MPLRLLIVSQYFWPESFLINEIVKTLLQRNVQVRVLTGKPNYPDGKVFDGYRAAGCLNEHYQNANVHRVPLIPRGKKNPIRLALNYLSFVVSGSIFGPWLLRRQKVDAILVYCPSPILQVLPALLIGRIKRAPVVTYVQDLWPDSLAATGYINNTLGLRFVGLVTKFIYRRSSLILISSRPFEESIKRLAPNSKIVYFPNSVDSSFCDPDAGEKPALPELDDGFSVVFAGNLGRAQAVNVIVEAAHLLRERRDLKFVVLGSGSELEWMRQQARDRRLDNLLLLGRFPSEAMPYLLSKASVLLATLADQEIFAATVPSKIQAYMAVGKPIIACMNGEGARIVAEAEAGLSVPAEDAAKLAEAVVRLQQFSQADRDRMGANSTAYYRRHFDHEKLVDDLIGHLQRLLNDQ